MNASPLYAAFVEAASDRGEREAFIFLDIDLRPTTYTFAQLFAAAEAVSRNMDESGLHTRSAPLGILLRSQEQQIIHYLAALRSGAVPALLTPPNPKLNREYYDLTLREVVRRSRFSAIVTDLDGIELPANLFTPTELEPVGHVELDDTPDATELDGASFLQFSSGTTGIKRGVLVSDEAIVAQLCAYRDAIRLSEDDRILSWLPLYHDMGFIACLNLPLYFGVTTVVLDPIDWVSRPSTFPAAAGRHRTTLSWNPNFAYSFMAQRIRDEDLVGVDLSSLRALVNCSEPVTYASQQRFLARFAPLGLRSDVFTGCYAMAETTFALTHGRNGDTHGIDANGPTNGVSGPDEPYVSVGRPLDGVELMVVDPDGRPGQERSIGELWVRSPFNLRGYFNAPEATADAFADDWYRTGDLGYRVGNEFFITGRKKDVLIVGGVNVFPSDIEDLGASVEKVHTGRVAAFSRFDGGTQTERVIVLAEVDDEDQDDRQVLIDVRQRLLASFQIANFEVHLVPPGWLVKSSSGKMARAASREKWETATGHGEPAREG